MPRTISSDLTSTSPVCTSWSPEICSRRFVFRPTWAGAQFYFEKVRDRNVWDFPLLNVASAMVVSGDRIERIRIAVNGAAARPLRLKAVEDAVRGKPRERGNR